ncbi:MAG: hypothetical protein AAGA96_03385 [Verrucomicrobiota bacterium]
MKFSLQTLCILFFVTLLHIMVIASLSTGSGESLWSEMDLGEWAQQATEDSERDGKPWAIVGDREPEGGESVQATSAEPSDKSPSNKEDRIPEKQSSDAPRGNEALAKQRDSQTSSTKVRAAIADSASYSGRVDQPDLQQVMATEMVSDHMKRTTTPRFEKAAEARKPSPTAVSDQGSREIRALKPLATSG